MASLENTPGALCYLIHLDRPYVDPNGRTVSHYLGFTVNLKARMAHHRQGTGARLLAVVAAVGIAFSVVRVWTPGSRAIERRLKGWKKARVLCPTCNQTRWFYRAKIETVCENHDAA